MSRPTGVFFSFLLLLAAIVGALSSDSDVSSTLAVKVEGRIVEPENLTLDFPTWLRGVSVQLDGGIYVTYPRMDGVFEFPAVAPGSYLVEVSNPSQAFERVRVDITQSGKLRARAWNILKPSEVKLVQYPLKLKSEGAIPFFRPREQWRITDFLFNPMVLMMVLPVLFIFIMPKMNQDDPEVRQQMQAMMNPSQNMPDMSTTLTNFFGGTDSGPSRRGGGASSSGSTSASRRSGSNKRS